MAGERGLPMSSSASRLSPLAPPFTSNRLYASALTPPSSLDDRHHENPYAGSLLRSLSGLGLESDSLGGNLMVSLSSEVASTDANPSYSQCLSSPLPYIHNPSYFESSSASTALPLDNASITAYGLDSALGCSAVADDMWNGLSYGVLGGFSHEAKEKSWVKQGMHAAEVTQPCFGAYTGSHRKYNENPSGSEVCNLEGPCATLKAGRKEVYQDKSFIENLDELKDYVFVLSSSASEDKFFDQKAVSDDAMDPLLREKSTLQVTHPNLLENSTSDLSLAERGVSDKHSGDFFDNFESDLDSPCWKGKNLASCSSSVVVEVSGPSHSQPVQNEPEVSRTLNPLAPKFVPGKAEGNVEYFSKLFYSEHQSVDAVKAEGCVSKLSMGVGTQCFDSIHRPRKEDALIKNSDTSSKQCYTHMVPQSLIEDFSRWEGKNITRDVVEGSFNTRSIGNASQHCSSCVSSLIMEQDPGLPSSGVIVPTELEGKLEDAFNSCSDPSKIDVQILVKSLLNLSELLAQSCSSDLDLLREHDHDVLQHVINNLYVCMRKKIRLRNPVSKYPLPGTTCYSRTSTDFCKGRDMGIRGTGIEAVGLAHQLYDPNEHEKQNSFSNVFSERGYKIADSSSKSDAGIEKVDDATQVIEKFLKENHHADEEMHQQVLLYKNLWLEAEAALCSMKHKACAARLKSFMD